MTLKLLKFQKMSYFLLCFSPQVFTAEWEKYHKKEAKHCIMTTFTYSDGGGGAGVAMVTYRGYQSSRVASLIILVKSNVERISVELTLSSHR